MRDTRLSGWSLKRLFRLALGMFALAAALPVTHAANPSEIDCVERDRHPSMDQLLHTAGELDISIVDLSTASVQSPPGAIEELSAPEGTSAAPHLYLGPRVATIVRDVFGDELVLDDSFKPADSPLGVGPAPVAESSNRDEPAMTVDSDSDDSANAGIYSPLRIHREMYRTDI